MPAQQLSEFRTNVARARDLVGLGQAIGKLTVGRVDSSDMYRAAWVQAVAALDRYVHRVVLERAIDIVLGRVPAGPKAIKLGLHFGAVRDIVATTTPADREIAVRSHVADRLAVETYQRPDDIANALSIVGVSKVWSSAFPTTAKTAITSLSLVIQRRNRIVHECDTDPTTPGAWTPLSASDATSSIEIVENTVVTIDQFC